MKPDPLDDEIAHLQTWIDKLGERAKATGALDARDVLPLIAALADIVEKLKGLHR